MEIKDIATGAGGGSLLGAILTWLGFKSRLDSIERSLDEHKKHVQYKDTCNARHSALDQRLESIEKKQDRILDILINGRVHG